MSIDIENIATACEVLSGSERDTLEQLLQAHGIAAGYIGYSGDSIQIPLHDRVRILQLKGEDIFTALQIDAAKIADSLTSLQESEWVSPLPPVTILSAGGGDVRISIPAYQLCKRWHWQIEIEQWSAALEIFSGEFEPENLPEIGFNKIGENAYSARSLSTGMLLEGELPVGYHLLSLKCLDSAENAVPETFTMALVMAPSRCYEPAWAVEGKRLWGLSVQLYSLRSMRNWGVGDFTDLQHLIRFSAGQGASFLALNPLHALDTENPLNCSPYSPIDRRRLNVIYIDPEIEPEFGSREAWQKKIKSLKSAGSTSNTNPAAFLHYELIEYPAVMQLKLEVLTVMYRNFVKLQLQEQTPRGRAFEQFVTQAGKGLLEFAIFEAQRADASVNTCASEPRFYLYTQWLAEQQLAMCQQLAQQQGMRIGLIRDLAVGSTGAGAEVVLSKGLFSELSSIGAPPDPLAPQGQNWGLPPLDPSRLREHAYQHFIELLRANMAHCGALRIDHVMALMRLWWCPRGSHRGDGAYVYYPVDDLFALLRLESRRNSCVVIGEDLGIVPPEVRTYLRTSAIFSNVLFYFEKYDGFHFKRPQHYPLKALAMVANHDVPTLAAWWNISDLDLRYQLNLIASETELNELRELRIAEKEQVLRLLEEQWLLPESWRGDVMDKAFDLSLCLALLQCCARSASQLLTVQLEDFMLLETPVNIPGTSTQYPNWQRKLPVDLNELLSSESVARIVTEIATIRAD